MVTNRPNRSADRPASQYIKHSITQMANAEEQVPPPARLYSSFYVQFFFFNVCGRLFNPIMDQASGCA